MAKEHIPDLILSDVMMPNVDGISLTRQLKQDIKTSHIPIVLLIAKGDAGSKLDGLTALANDYITKPFDSDKLRLKLDNLLRFKALMIQHLSKTSTVNTDDTHIVDIALNATEQAFKQTLDDIIEARYQQQDFTVQQIAKALFITAKQLQRKLKDLFW
jgi:DNA-binding response OmpR family regulator